MQNYDPGYGAKFPVDPICYQTPICRCPGTTTRNEGCAGWCPGSAKCGGGSFGNQNNQNESGYPCGVRGELCTTLLDVPVLESTTFNADSVYAFQCMNLNEPTNA